MYVTNTVSTVVVLKISFLVNIFFVKWRWYNIRYPALWNQLKYSIDIPQLRTIKYHFLKCHTPHAGLKNCTTVTSYSHHISNYTWRKSPRFNIRICNFPQLAGMHGSFVSANRPHHLQGVSNFNFFLQLRCKQTERRDACRFWLWGTVCGSPRFKL